jgi:mannan endo-1,4-beta-mannosidase
MGCDDFYTDPNAIQLYKNHVRTMLTRVNTVTGLEYGSDPTIMGESPGLAIENPRCF